MERRGRALSGSVRSRLVQYSEVIGRDLDRSVGFWLRHSHDQHFGGFLTCLDGQGEVYDTTKYGWLQARQVWMYARLYNDMPRFHTEEIRTAIERGCDFLHHLKCPTTWRCYFSVTRQGSPLKLQRTIFTECFYLLALSEASKALGKAEYQLEAVAMLGRVCEWVEGGAQPLVRPRLAGQAPSSSLARPMMLLCCMEQLTRVQPDLEGEYSAKVDKLVQEILSHSQRDGRVVLENVSPAGEELPGVEGRLLSPGHAIECGWFLLDLAQKRNDVTLAKRALLEFIISPLEYGWDQDHGGLFYFMDADRKPLPVLEADMKLWWPHCEALVATLKAFAYTRDDQLLDSFDTLFAYAYARFCDKSGEWFGYLNRQGEVVQDLKGGPFKGCFHVPRYLMECEQVLSKLLLDS